MILREIDVLSTLFHCTFYCFHEKFRHSIFVIILREIEVLRFHEFYHFLRESKHNDSSVIG